MAGQHYRTRDWVQRGLFQPLGSFEDFESRVNSIPEEKDRGDVFEIFIEGYLATQSIAQCKEHWVVGSIPLALRERYNLPSDGTGIDGIYEATDGTHVAYQVKYRQKPNLTYQEAAPPRTLKFQNLANSDPTHGVPPRISLGVPSAAPYT